LLCNGSCSRRDIALSLLPKTNIGATPSSNNDYCGNGGIKYLQQGELRCTSSEQGKRFDVFSKILQELAKTSVGSWCAGRKSILDPWR